MSSSRKIRIAIRILPLIVITMTLLWVNQRLGAQSAPPAAPGAPASQPAQHDPNVFELFLSGGVFMWALLACSIGAVAIILERFVALRKDLIIPPSFMPGLRNVVRDITTDREAGIAYCKANDSPISRMIMAGLKRLPRGLVAAEKAIEDAGSNESLKLRRFMRFLYALGSVGTLLGLVGTISGMIKAFQATAKNATGGGDKVAALSTGIYEAFVCTYGGLVVAIIVTVFYYFFVGRIEKMIHEINDELAAFADEYGFNNKLDFDTPSALPSKKERTSKRDAAPPPIPAVTSVTP